MSSMFTEIVSEMTLELLQWRKISETDGENAVESDTTRRLKSDFQTPFTWPKSEVTPMCVGKISFLLKFLASHFV